MMRTHAVLLLGSFAGLTPSQISTPPSPVAPSKRSSYTSKSGVCARLHPRARQPDREDLLPRALGSSRRCLRAGTRRNARPARACARGPSAARRSSSPRRRTCIPSSASSDRRRRSRRRPSCRPAPAALPSFRKSSHWRGMLFAHARERVLAANTGEQHRPALLVAHGLQVAHRRVPCAGLYASDQEPLGVQRATGRGAAWQAVPRSNSIVGRQLADPAHSLCSAVKARSCSAQRARQKRQAAVHAVVDAGMRAVELLVDVRHAMLGEPLRQQRGCRSASGTDRANRSR